jgi:hypothetical protein
MSNQALEDFAKKEKERLETERAVAIKAKGGLPYLDSLKVGETLLHLHHIVPTQNDYEGRKRKQFVVSKPNSEEKLGWTVAENSPLYKDLLDILVKAPCDIRVIRTGTTKSDTRYTVLKA